MANWEGGGHRRGRRRAIRADTDEAAALARWLSALTQRLTIRDLADRFPYGKTKWAAFLNGSELVPDWLLEQVVDGLVREPRLRAKMLIKGRDLLERAEQAAAGRVFAVTGGLSEQELQRRLDQARRGQLEAEKALLGTMTLVMVLLNVLHNLQKRHEMVHEQSARDRQRLQLAQAHLQQARAVRDEAEDLHLRSHALVEQYRRLLGAGRDRPPRLRLVSPQLRPLSEHECEHLLAEAKDYLERAWVVLGDLRRRLELSPADRSDGPIPFVRGQTVDNSEPAILAGRPTHPPGGGVVSFLPRRRVLISLSAAAATALLSTGDGAARPSASARPVTVPFAGGTAGDSYSTELVGPYVDPFADPDSDYVEAVAVGTLAGKTIAVAGHADGTLLVWDLVTRHPVAKFVFGGGLAAENRAVAVGTLNGRTIAVSGAGQVWDLVTLQQLSEFGVPHPVGINAVAVGELNGRTIVVSGGADDVRVWDPVTGNLVGTPHRVAAGQVGPEEVEGRAVAVGTLGGRTIAAFAAARDTLRVWDPASGTPVGKPIKTKGSVAAVAIDTMNDKTIAVTIAVSGDGSISAVQLWDLATGDSLGELGTLPGDALPALNPDVATGTLDGKTIAASVGLNGLQVWDLATGQSVWPGGEPQPVMDEARAVAVGTMSGNTIAVINEGNAVRVFLLGRS